MWVHVFPHNFPAYNCKELFFKLPMKQAEKKKKLNTHNSLVIASASYSGFINVQLACSFKPVFSIKLFR